MSASTTTLGFWLVAALSRYTRGLPWTFSLRIGKSARTASTLNAGDFTFRPLAFVMGWTVVVMGSFPSGIPSLELRFLLPSSDVIGRLHDLSISPPLRRAAARRGTASSSG